MTSSFVLGFRAVRGARSCILKDPKPRISIRSSAMSASFMTLIKPLITASVSIFVRPVPVATRSMISALVTSAGKA